MKTIYQITLKGYKIATVDKLRAAGEAEAPGVALALAKKWVEQLNNGKSYRYDQTDTSCKVFQKGKPRPVAIFLAADDDFVYCWVDERPNWVTALYKGEIHRGQWSTVHPGENGIGEVVSGNAGLLNAVMYAWDGAAPFVLPFKELEEHSGGWGAWS